MPRFEDPETLVERIQAFWDAGIPMAGHMRVRLVRLDEGGLVARAPLAANRNHMGTAFGGSVHGVATLAGWGLVLALLEVPQATDLVIQESRIRFLRPVTGDFEAHCEMPPAPAPERFLRLFNARGRARITVEARVRQGNSTAAEFTGVFAALRQEGKTPG